MNSANCFKLARHRNSEIIDKPMHSTAHFAFSRHGHNPVRRLTALLLLACLPVIAAAEDAFIEGSASYRERIALTPDAIFEATLQDVSLADAPAEILGRVTIPTPGQPPIRFRIPYDVGRIEAHHRYAVRATIHRAEKLIFVTDQFYPVLTKPNDRQVTLILKHIGTD